MSNSDNMLADPRQHLPLAPLDFQVLMLLSERPLHGYGIVKAAHDKFEKSSLELGSLYRIVSRLTKQGLIEDSPAELYHSKRPRRYYRTTELGTQVVRAEAKRLRAMLASQHALELLEE